MWKDVIPEIPTYLFLGKGYAMSGRETDVAQMNQRRSFEVSELAGDYHNGPLSVILPLGIFGAATFVWFLVSGLRVMYRNYKFGDPSFQRINTFLFALFLQKVIFFMAIFGSLYVDLFTFTGLVALSVSINGGMAKPAVVQPVSIPALNRPRFAPGLRRPVGI
jgi:O-antigen ligase